ncbi:MAG: hypothetical protein AAGE61_00875 [Pseudomonadota bacterium]
MRKCLSYTRDIGSKIFIKTSLIFFLFLLQFSISNAPVALERKQLDEIKKFAKELCGDYYKKSSAKKLDLDANASARISGLFSRLAQIGLGGAAAIDTNETIGVLQKDAASEISDIRDCREKIWDDLKGIVLANTSPGSAVQQARPCLQYRVGRIDNVACDGNTANGYYWHKIRRFGRYPSHGFKPADGARDLTCGPDTVGIVGRSFRFPPAHPHFLGPIRNVLNPNPGNPPNEWVPDDCLGHGKSICGMFDFECRRQG